MAYPGEWLEGYGLAPEPGAEEPSNGELLPFSCRESLISLELAECLMRASSNLSYRADAPLEIPRSRSIVLLPMVVGSGVCVSGTDYRQTCRTRPWSQP